MKEKMIIAQKKDWMSNVETWPQLTTLANHKVKKAATMAAMRKMILIAHAIYQNKTEYVLR